MKLVTTLFLVRTCLHLPPLFEEVLQKKKKTKIQIHEYNCFLGYKVYDDRIMDMNATDMLSAAELMINQRKMSINNG